MFKPTTTFTPWLVAPVPPKQFKKVSVPDEPVVIAPVWIVTPCELVAELLDCPVIVIEPDVLVKQLVRVHSIPYPNKVETGTIPLRMMGPETLLKEPEKKVIPVPPLELAVPLSVTLPAPVTFIWGKVPGVLL